MSTLVDQHGNPLRKELLTREVAGPTLAGVRSPIAGYPADGMTPLRLADLLREADQGEPQRFFELAELIEERDLHYAGVLGTRKRSVSQIDVTVEAASDDKEDVDRADLVRDWLKRDELADETFDILDAVGKGVSWTEIVWETSEGHWWPGKLIWRDPRHFTFDPKDLTTPMLRGGIEGNGQPEPLPPLKFIEARIKAKSGLPIRSGLARLAAWAWMFKAFTQRDWAIFTQTYGQPVRVGRFHEGATKEDKATLFRAVANIAGDCAAIIPKTMEIEFISADTSTGTGLYMERADWLDRQVSKAVVGQTNTSDAQAGGLGSGQANVHNDVREDIETADCKALSATLNRDLIRSWMDLEFGPDRMKGRYPRLVIARPQPEDLQLLADSMSKLVPLGLRVQQSEIRDKFGLSDPEDDTDLLHTPRPAAPPATPIAQPAPDPADAPAPDPAAAPALQAQQPAPVHPVDLIAARADEEGEAAIGLMTDQIEVMLQAAGDLSEFRLMLSSAYPDLDSSSLAGVLAGGLAAARAAGMSDLEDESEGA